jgi:hypothetical protein
MARATRRSGNRSTTGSASTSKHRWTSRNPTNTGAVTSISTPGSSITAARSVFGSRFLEIARGIRDDPPPELVCQSLDPWLDQVALPLVIHDLGGGRDALAPGWLDGSHSCHYRLLPLLYAREADRGGRCPGTVAAPQPDQEGPESP